MRSDYVLNAEVRVGKGRQASRRLRRAGKIPAILYGGGDAPIPIEVEHKELQWNLEHEAFYSQILSVKFNNKVERAILRDLQRHPSKPQILHIDLQRVRVDEEIRVNVPLHFMGEESSPGVKQQGGVVSHMLTEVEVECLPENLPEYIAVDVSNLQLNEAIRLSDLVLPQGVQLVELVHGEQHDHMLMTINPPRADEAAAPGAQEQAPGSSASGETGSSS
jgi:large subunit ribosomal protein L25